MDEGRSEKNSGTEPVTVSREEETLLALKRELPDYVVESFMATGYDTLQVIAKMDTSRNPGNSLEEIEQFISTEFIEDPHFARGITSIHTFKFLPGDRQRIINFISNIRKNLDQEEKAKRLNTKRTATKSNHAQSIKRKKENSDTDVVSNDTGDLLDQAKAVTMVQQQICKWQRSQSSSKIKELKENEHFEINTSTLDHSTSGFCVTISCKMCGHKSTLGFKDHTVLLSNYTRHVNKCIEKADPCPQLPEIVKYKNIFHH